MKVLVVLPNWIGDVVMSLPVLTECRKIFNNAEIKILIKKSIFPLIEQICNDLHIEPVFYEKKDLSETVKLIKIINSEKFDKAFILPRSFRMFAISLFSGIREKYGYADFFKKFFYKKSLKRDKKSLSKHRVFYYMDILNLYKNVNYNIFPELKLTETAEEFAKRFINDNNLENKILIGLNPGATYGLAKCWPVDNYNMLLDKISKQFTDVHFLIFGGKDNIEYNNMINSPDTTNLTGKLNIAESAALIKKCKIFITNDTGPMHIADALNVEIIAIFGPTDPDETPPFRKREHIIYKSLPCSPCKERICPLNHHKCMLMITPDEVLIHVKNILEGVNA